jgi:hypothetical protein
MIKESSVNNIIYENSHGFNLVENIIENIIENINRYFTNEKNFHEWQHFKIIKN